MKIKWIGIMVFSRNRKKSILRAYTRVAPKDIKLFTFTPSSINWDTKRIHGLHFVNNELQGKWFAFPAVVYNRCYGTRLQLVQRIEKIIGKDRCFNHVNHFDKQSIYDVLHNTELKGYLPTTAPYSEARLDDLLNDYRTVYLKPALGNGGFGVYRVHKQENDEIYISQHYFRPYVICRDRLSFESEIKKLVQSRKYLVQQGISIRQIDNKNFDMRVLVQKNQAGSWGITNIVSRTAYHGCFNTSVCENVAPSSEILQLVLPENQQQSLLETLSEVSLKAATLLEQNSGYHLGELSVDFGLDDSGMLWIIEINGNPQRTMYKGLDTYDDVYRNPLSYAQYLMSQQDKSPVESKPASVHSPTRNSPPTLWVGNRRNPRKQLRKRHNTSSKRSAR